MARPATPGASAGRAATSLPANRQRAVEAKSEFDAAHADGQRSFKAGDLSGLAKAIDKERQAIRKFMKATTPQDPTSPTTTKKSNTK